MKIKIKIDVLYKNKGNLVLKTDLPKVDSLSKAKLEAVSQVITESIIAKEKCNASDEALSNSLSEYKQKRNVSKSKNHNETDIKGVC